MMEHTTLMQKDKNKSPVSSNYRPITCLPTIWKLLTSILSTVVHKHLTDNDVCCFLRRKVVKRAAEVH